MSLATRGSTHPIHDVMIAPSVRNHLIRSKLNKTWNIRLITTTLFSTYPARGRRGTWSSDCKTINRSH
ncbi:hypothetical protein CGRA01v4_07378 [Colletotrichum graminicola]|nr:hypothetical protein CGRA01v4_07378 [Colletotrichum graminicola]